MNSRPVPFLLQTSGTHHALLVVKVDEAEVDLVAGQLAPVVQAQDDLVLGQGGVDAGQAGFKLLIQLERQLSY